VINEQAHQPSIQCIYTSHLLKYVNLLTIISQGRIDLKRLCHKNITDVGGMQWSQKSTVGVDGGAAMAVMGQ